MSRRLRVVQWATGNIGTRAALQVLRDPRLELVGMLVYDPSKAGRDVGEICGQEPTGVAATADKRAVIELDADCVLYMPRAAELDDVVAMLERGTNVVTTCGDFQAGGRALSVEARQRIDAACARGNTSIYATGSSPGFITDALPLALLSLQCRVDRIEIEEYANLSERNSPHLLFEQMGYARPMTTPDPRRAAHLLTQFGPPLEELAEHAGKRVDDWSAYGELAAATRDLTIAAGPIPAGTVAAQRTVISGSSAGEEVVRFTATWYCSTDLDPRWDLLATGWRVRTYGDAPLNVSLEFPFAVEDLGAHTPGYTANRPVNAIPYVVAAVPGILETTDLPPLTPAGD
ncbi:MAG TPA: dihydrodipicolinate reductase [Mycobacteriales bacterium]|nr:dihydrodipicolinate reductase [Mycobacteriales bacterium]HWB68123.1 dihydrodipicolinate reductase [Mycobacteriales bacterium]